MSRVKCRVSIATHVLGGAFLCAVLAACSVTKKVTSAFGGQLPVQVQIADDANEDSPIAFDTVIVYDKDLVEALLKMSANDWFAKKKQFIADHQSDVAVQSWEWVPGQIVEPLSIDYRPGAKKVVLFAYYQTEGDHRAVIQPRQPAKIVFNDREFSVEAQQ